MIYIGSMWGRKEVANDVLACRAKVETLALGPLRIKFDVVSKVLYSLVEGQL